MTDMPDNVNTESQMGYVTECFRILDCKIQINVNRDLRTAFYTYTFTIKALKEGLNRWREEFVYNKSDISDIKAYDNEGGLQDTTENNGQHTILWIDFRNTLATGDNYCFTYEVKTKIESHSKMHPILGGTGAIWFYCSYRFHMDSFVVQLRLPKGFNDTTVHPHAEKENGIIKISKANLVPSEFFLTIIQVEKKLLGMNPILIEVLSRLFWIILGAIITLIITESYRNN